MNTSNLGIALIKEFESFSPKPYLCPAGKLTIGYGHLIKAGETFTTLTEEEALFLLKKDVEIAENAVKTIAGCSFNQYMFDALVSFCFNLGGGALEQSTLLSYLKIGRLKDAAKEFEKWNKAGGQVLQGLVTRRKTEKILFEAGRLEAKNGNGKPYPLKNNRSKAKFRAKRR